MKFFYEDTSQVSKDDLAHCAKSLQSYVSHLQEVAVTDDYLFDESSINLSFDENSVEKAISLKESLVTSSCKYVLDIGIGGSNLGTKAIYDAIFGYFDLVDPNRFPKIIFADTNDPAFLSKLQNLLHSVESSEEIVINVISKSGGTTEPIANMEFLLKEIPSFKKRLVLTTDEGSNLWNAGKEQGVELLSIPKKVGGRYSVLSSVGLFPLACVGLNIVELLEGAMTMRKACISGAAESNPALMSACVLYLNFKNKKVINDTFFFHPELESLGKWYRQLMGESIGKNGIGITPTVSIGSTDLHSMGQLYLGGPRDKFFTLVSTNCSNSAINSVVIPKEPPFPLVIDELKNKSAQQIMSAIFTGVKIAYQKNNIPFAQILLDDISENSLGQFLQFKMIEMMYLGKLLDVNAFDQPNVESFKIETKKILEKS